MGVGASSLRSSFITNLLNGNIKKMKGQVTLATTKLVPQEREREREREEWRLQLEASSKKHITEDGLAMAVELLQQFFCQYQCE